jgi:hypothetical protein
MRTDPVAHVIVQLLSNDFRICGFLVLSIGFAMFYDDCHQGVEV